MFTEQVREGRLCYSAFETAEETALEVPVHGGAGHAEVFGNLCHGQRFVIVGKIIWRSMPLAILSDGSVAPAFGLLSVLQCVEFIT
jgi:hypothetical protein